MSNPKQFVWNGVIYKSQSDAARALGVSTTTIYRWVKKLEQTKPLLSSNIKPSLYIIGSDVGLTKVGVATNVEHRLSKMQTGSPSILHLIDNYETDIPFDLERVIHDRFKKKRKHGEWFNLSKGDISWIRQNCADIEASVYTNIYDQQAS